MPDVVNLVGRFLLSAVFIVYGYLALSDIHAWLNFNQGAFKRFFGMNQVEKNRSNQDSR